MPYSTSLISYLTSAESGGRGDPNVVGLEHVCWQSDHQTFCVRAENTCVIFKDIHPGYSAIRSSVQSPQELYYRTLDRVDSKDGNLKYWRSERTRVNKPVRDSRRTLAPFRTLCSASLWLCTCYYDVLECAKRHSNMTSFPDYYNVLTIPKNASTVDIWQAYRRESLKSVSFRALLRSKSH